MGTHEDIGTSTDLPNFKGKLYRLLRVLLVPTKVQVAVMEELDL